MNFVVNRKINSMIKDVVNYIMDTIKEVSLEYGIDAPGFYLYTDLLEMKDSGINLDAFFDHSMTTVTKALYKGEDDGSGIITGTYSVITMSKCILFEMILTCEMDFDKLKESLHLLIRHEIGHVIDLDSFKGKTCNEWSDYMRLNREELSRLPKLRKNASLESELRSFIMYNNTTLESKANEIMGITIDDWIDSFCREANCNKNKFKLEDLI